MLQTIEGQSQTDSFAINYPKGERLSTGSVAFDTLLQGGIPTCAITDIFGGAGSGKTQFAYQCAMIVSLRVQNKQKIGVAFVDCDGSFRPERIAEMVEEREPSRKSLQVLESISSIRAGSVREQQIASERLLSGEEFSKCKLVIVDDVTRNFVSEFGTKEKELIARQHELSMFMRKLGQIAITKNVALLLTNTVRSRLAEGEGETAGNIISQFALFRIHLRNLDRERSAEIVQPNFKNRTCKFEIETRGVVP
jgi:RecA/RadA recombinase